MEIERYPQVFRERYDIAFSQAVILVTLAFLYMRTFVFFFLSPVDLSDILDSRSSLVGSN